MPKERVTPAPSASCAPSQTLKSLIQMTWGVFRAALVSDQVFLKVSMSLRESHFYEFGPFRLLPGERRLLRGGEAVPLPPKAFDTLQVLVEDAGHLLDKETLLQRIWADSFVEEGNLAQNVFLLRRALGQNEMGAEFIETVPKSGYRFVAAVRVVGQEAPVPVAASVAAPAPPASRNRGWVARVALAGLFLSAGYFVWWGSRPVDPGIPARISIAVLPFENLTGDPEQDYLSDGFTEEILTQLSRMNPDRLGVIARTSAMHYKGARADVQQISSELGVEFLLEGSVRREGGRIRIAAQLIRARDRTHLWADSFERDAREFLPLETEVSGVIAREVSTHLLPREVSAPVHPRVTNVEAREDFLRGRYFWNRRTEADYVRAIANFQRALAAEPNYAEAYAGLADTYALLGSMPNAEMPRSEAMPRAKQAAQKAIALDESLAEAHTSLAFVMMHYEWDWPNAEREFRRALQLNANYATAHQWFAFCLIAVGRTQESIGEIERARQLDPLSLILNTDTAELLVYAGRLKEGEQQARRALEMDPNFVLAHRALGIALREQKRYPESLAEFRKALALSGDNPWMKSDVAQAEAVSGDAAGARRLLAEVRSPTSLRFTSAGTLAPALLALGGRDAAMQDLEKGYEQHSGMLVLVKVMPELAPLHPDPRFQDLLRRMQLAP